MALYPSTVQSTFPALWFARLQVAYRKALVYGDVCNRQYEGEIREMGDTVRIQTVADITINSTYTRDAVITGQSLTTTDMVLTITQSTNFNFKWDITNQKQSAVKNIMEEAMSRSAYQMADLQDQFIADTMVAGVATAAPDNTLTAVTDVGVGAGETDPYDILVDLNTLLSQSSVPREGRWVIVPPWFAGELAKVPARVSFGTVPNLAIFSGGYEGIDRVSGLRVYVSNNVPVTGGTTPTTGAYSIVAGHSDGITFANQLTKYKSAEQPDGFYTNNLGIMLYGALANRPYALASVAATKAA
jgi:hypothetical protein